MTRIRFCGRRLPSRPLSPVCTGLPRVEIQLSAPIRCTGRDRPPASRVRAARATLEGQMTSNAPAPGTDDAAAGAGDAAAGAASPAAPGPDDAARIVIAGGGLAGLRPVEELRALG